MTLWNRILVWLRVRHKNAAALAWIEAWYATPDETPPGDWEALLAALEPPPRRTERAGIPAE